MNFHISKFKGDFKPLHSDPVKSPTLPGFLYHQEDIFEREKKRIFYKSWQIVGHVSQIQSPGDFITSQIVDEQILVIRGQDWIIRGFYNVCQHRAHKLVNGQGHLKSAIVCPYHNWTYNMNGDLTGVRHCSKQKQFDNADYGLVPIRVEEMLGFIFVNLDPDAFPLADIPGNMFGDIASEVPYLGKMIVSPELFAQSFHGSTLKANWKVLAENSMENYHVGPIHPAYLDMVNLEEYDWKLCGKWTKGKGKVKNLQNDAYDLDPSDPCQEAITWRLWPNMAFFILPGDMSFSAFSFYPVTPNLTRLSSIPLMLPGTTVRPDQWGYLWDTIWAEDVAVCESVHKGLKSQGYRQGRFMINDDFQAVSEHGPHFFQVLYAEAMNMGLI